MDAAVVFDPVAAILAKRWFSCLPGKKVIAVSTSLYNDPLWLSGAADWFIVPSLSAAKWYAQKGFEEIRRWSAGKRSEHLFKLAELLKEHQEEIVELMISEAGKPRGYANNEMSRCITTTEMAATEALRFGGEVVPMDFAAGEGKTAFY